MTPPAPLRLHLPARREALPAARQALLDWAGAALPAGRARYAAELVLEEAFLNILSYAGPHAAALGVELSARLDDGLLHLEFVDDGAPFDPTVERPVPDDQPGGRGLRLMRRFASTLAYRREDGRNRLEAGIALAAASPPSTVVPRMQDGAR